jgi:hypothetical protein
VQSVIGVNRNEIERTVGVANSVRAANHEAEINRQGLHHDVLDTHRGLWGVSETSSWGVSRLFRFLDKLPRRKSPHG